MKHTLESGLQLHYEYKEAKQAHENTRTLVLIHGMGFDLTSWDRIVPYMEDEFHLLRYDFRGHGQSGTDSIDPSKLAWIYVEHLDSLLRRLGIEQFDIISHGAGCIIGLYYTKVYPAKVRSNVMLSLPLFNSSSTAGKYADYRKNLVKHQSMSALAGHVVPNATLFQPGTPEINRLFAAFARVSFDSYIELLDFFAGAHDEIMEMFKKHTGPLLLLTGERDPMYPPYLSGLIASANPNCRFMTVYNASNMLFYDQPEETYKQIRMFFDTETSNRAPLDPYLLELHSDFIGMVNGEAQLDDTSVPAAPVAPVARLKVTLLKSFQVFLDDTQVLGGWGRRSAKELLIYLLLHPGAARDQLCEDLWKDMENTKARSQLRVCLNHLKQLLNNEETRLLYSDNQQISLMAPVDCDLLTLLENTRLAVKETDPARKDSLIQGVFQQVDDELFRNLDQDWNLNLRTRLEIDLVALAHYEADVLAKLGKYTRAIACLKYVILFNPEEYDAYERIAVLYELNQQKQEARTWHSKLAMLQPAPEKPGARL
ncbi:alpha/beta fold hydrolase [Paenibacillus typhae]|uniref:alpha/beta fold hydrolase n=1 Tax=Paenibacillus typhae TaxID=1174501 RepID=UPI001C8ECF44|nr:alpha/beta fold hydrolase [Paenibacillus typhae]MBY0009921.1 alpha/beta fold hydrolase [Paenibacillus typhae]